MMSKQLDHWRTSGELVKVDGRHLFVRRSSASDTVILCLHGFPASSWDYHKVWDDLASRAPVAAFDMLGYGFSDKPADADYTTALQADLVGSLLAKLGIKNVHIVSHDYGNTIVQELLARRSERGLDFRIRSICFLNGALFPETHRPILAQKIFIGPFGKLFGQLIPPSVFKANLAKVFGDKTKPTAAELDEFHELFFRNGGKKIAHKLIRYMREREVYRERWLAALRSIDVPFRFINGLADPVSGAHLVKRFRELLPEQTDICELPEIGHFPHFETPAECARLIKEFHDRVGLAG